MALDETGLLVKLEANVAKWEKDFNRAITQQQRASQRMEQIARQNARKISSAYEGIGGKIGANLGKLALPLAGGFSAAVLMRQVKNYTALADAATQMQNALRVAGLEGDKLTDVYGKLYQSAQRNAAPISSLVDLYAKLSLTQNELGVSSDELIRFTDGIAVALRVGGTDAQAASGSLLQLSQALGGGTVRAEEFNSILEGTPTIAQAVARGLKEAGGSVAELRKLVMDGQVSSAAFFRAFEAGSAELRQQAASTQMTTGQAFTRLGNALVTVVGDFDKATGASATFADGIADLANGLDNFDTEGFVAKVQKIIDVFADAEEAGTAWLNSIGNWDGWSNLSDAMGGTEDGNILNPDVSAAETKIAGLEKDVTDLQAQIENNSSLGFDNTEAITRLREVRNELAALRAEAANMPRYVAGPRDPANMDTGAFYDGTGYTPLPAAPASNAPVSIKDH
ncbi:tape measure protein [Paracoccus aminovorans]|uniref:tape measure protein n=1 Tax=Paracoccus aminovorans TaxID=34004 RepID=UPI002B258276|nr:tape measure protein [Paracoccus aminovorans]